MPRTRLYRNGALERDDVPWSQTLELLHDETAVLWIDYVAPSEEQLAQLAQALQLHPLAIESAMHPHQRPKLERYNTHQFMAAYVLALPEGVVDLQRHEVDAFITQRALVTVRADESFSMVPVLETWDAHTEIASCGVDFLLWGLLDVIVDTHFDTVQRLDDAIELLEDNVLDTTPDIRMIQERSYRVRKNLVLMRQLTVPMRDVVSSLLHRNVDLDRQVLQPYFQDLYDHVLRAADWTDSLRDLVSTVIDTNLTNQSNRMNLVMKKVTSWAAIIAVPTLVTGFFGQNVLFPLLNTVAGFWVSSGIMAASAVTLYIQFRRLDWL
ncbi:magnesium transporter CorA family protein [Leifsonia sp. Root112D2]|jgi:magnesium transporter|uniref:magnesium transporter CorA family protein n=1 Tax=Leifsonia sp. Root112D2 TaxID=1736426 RepID=UPI0006F3D85F|nr:magnesium transporter CorA family protein [Leifsonia sp. Root112D2]KQV07390.1 magnesium transporter [Leifsonia sp. Root112D2]